MRTETGRQTIMLGTPLCVSLSDTRTPLGLQIALSREAKSQIQNL